MQRKDSFKRYLARFLEFSSTEVVKQRLSNLKNLTLETVHIEELNSF